MAKFRSKLNSVPDHDEPDDERLDDIDADDPLEHDEPVKPDEVHRDQERGKDDLEEEEDFVVDLNNVTSHQCPHCLTFHTFPFDVIFAYVCETCGESVEVENPVQ